MSRYQPKATFDDRRVACLDIETISSAETEDGMFPPWASHFPVCASVLTADRDKNSEWHFEINSILFGQDDDPFVRLEELLKGRSCVTFSGRGFDIPVLLLAAQATRNFCVPALTAAGSEPRFASARHYDLAEKYSLFGAARGATLAMLCEAVGVASKVTAHGSDVGRLHDEGKIDEIVEYCEGDVASTLLLFAHCRAMEKGDPIYHASLTSQFARWIHAQGLDHLTEFANIEDLSGLLRQSLIEQIDAATRHADLNAALQAKRAIDASFCPAERY